MPRVSERLKIYELGRRPTWCRNGHRPILFYGEDSHNKDIDYPPRLPRLPRFFALHVGLAELGGAGPGWTEKGTGVTGGGCG